MSARHVIYGLLVASIVCGMTGCANRGKLKSPSQIAAGEAKKARKAQKKGDDTLMDDDAAASHTDVENPPASTTPAPVGSFPPASTPMKTGTPSALESTPATPK